MVDLLCTEEYSLLISRNSSEGGSSNKNCSFRGEVGSLDEKSSFQDKHGPSLNRAHGWLCRSSLFSFFRGFAGQRFD